MSSPGYLPPGQQNTQIPSYMPVQQPHPLISQEQAQLLQTLLQASRRKKMADLLRQSGVAMDADDGSPLSMSSQYPPVPMPRPSQLGDY